MVKGNTRACAINKNSINGTSGVMYNMKGTIDGSANCGISRQGSQEPPLHWKHQCFFRFSCSGSQEKL